MDNAPEHEAFWENARALVGELLARVRTASTGSGEVAYQLIDAQAAVREVDRALSELAQDESRLVALRDAVAANPMLRPKFELPDFSAEDPYEQLIVPLHEIAEIVRTLGLAHLEKHGSLLGATSWSDVRTAYEQYLLTDQGDHLADVVVPILGARFAGPGPNDSTSHSIVRATDMAWGSQPLTELNEQDRRVASKAEYVLLLRDVPVWVESIGRYHHMRPTYATRLEIHRFFQALNLYCSGPATWIAIAIKSHRWVATNLESVGRVEVIVERDFPSRIDAVSRRRGYSSYELDEQTATKVLDGAHRLSSCHKSVRLAIERLSTSSSRSSDEDRIIDLCIGLEALLGSGSGSGEVVNRIAVRGAAMLSRIGFGSSATIHTALKQTYTYRSQIVHGSAGPFKRQLLHIDGTPIHASRFALAALSALARTAIESHEFEPDRVDELFLFSAFDATARAVTG